MRLPGQSLTRLRFAPPWSDWRRCHRVTSDALQPAALPVLPPQEPVVVRRDAILERITPTVDAGLALAQAFVCAMESSSASLAGQLPEDQRLDHVHRSHRRRPRPVARPVMGS